MRIHDSLIGGVLLVLALAVLWHIQGFPPAAGQKFGPAVFPGLIATGLALSSAVLIVAGAAQPGSPRSQLGRGRALAAAAGAPSAIAVASIAFYVLLSERLGFLLCSLLILVALQWALRRRGPGPRWPWPWRPPC